MSMHNVYVKCLVGVGAGAVLAFGSASARAEGDEKLCERASITLPAGMEPLVSKCAPGETLYGVTDEPPSTEIFIDEQRQTLKPCAAGRALGPFEKDKALCFDFSVDPTKEHTYRVRRAGVQSEPVKLSLFRAPPPPGSSGIVDPSAKGNDERAQRWYEAYRAGLRRIGKWVEESNAPAKDMLEFTSWYEARTHISLRSENTYVLFYDEETAVEPLPQIDEDDTIVVIAVPRNGHTITELRATGCDPPPDLRVAESAAPILVNGAADREPKAKHRMLLARRCGSEVGLKAVLQVEDKAGQGAKSSKDIAIPTLSLSRFTIGLGLLFDFGDETQFRAAAVKGETTPILVQDTKLAGLKAVPFVSLRPFRVDSKRTRQFWPPEWLGISAGISLTDPLDHLYLGALVEPFAGFGFTAGAHFQRVPHLAGGYVVGDRFSGGDVPVDKRWDIDKTSFFIGLNGDAALFAKIFAAMGGK